MATACTIIYLFDFLQSSLKQKTRLYLSIRGCPSGQEIQKYNRHGAIPCDRASTIFSPFFVYSPHHSQIAGSIQHDDLLLPYGFSCQPESMVWRYFLQVMPVGVI